MRTHSIPGFPGEDRSIDLVRSLRLVRPRTPGQLHSYLQAVLGFNVPRTAVVPGHDAPFDYLCHAFFEDRTPRDLVVWASRGSGKTQLAAIATLLDMLFKHGIQIRILGGSFEQSSRMHEYLRHLLTSDAFSDLIAGRFTDTHVKLRNGSGVQVLSQSQRDVRGQRVHKLRCDEVEMFEPDVWEAAQLITRTGLCRDTLVRGSIEALSTMHKREGLMSRLVGERKSKVQTAKIQMENQQTGSNENLDVGRSTRRVFRWNVLDVVEHCPDWRRCETCPLFNVCQGRAKSLNVNGFVRIDDVIAQLHRVGEATWKAEMLCERPDVSDAVFPEFDSGVHVFGDESMQLPAHDRRLWCAGIDFGFRAPTVILWAVIDRADAGAALWVVDELVVREHTTQEVIDLAQQRMAERGMPRPEFLAADPAGLARNEHTGISTIALWRRAKFTVRTCQSQIEPGVLAVRRRLKRADGTVTLRIHRRCEQLIQAMQTYRYPAPRGRDVHAAGRPPTLPLKDGPDHACDALRYLVTNLDGPGHATASASY